MLGVEGASLHIRNLPNTQPKTLKRVRRAYLDQGLSVSLFSTSANFSKPEAELPAEHEKAREAVRTAAFLGAPLLRVFPGGASPTEADWERVFERAAQAVRRVAKDAAQVGLPVGLQNHNHRALCRTADEVIRFFQQVDHPNLTFVLDRGQVAGSKGASGEAMPDLKQADFMESIRQTVSLARHVRVKFYRPGPDRADAWIDYEKVFDILRSVHCDGFLDIVYEPGREENGPGEEARTALPRVVGCLRSLIRYGEARPSAKRVERSARYVGLRTGRYFEQVEVRNETSVTFLEGPAVDQEGNVFFTNIPVNRILRWNPRARQLDVFRESSNAANGLLFDGKGRPLGAPNDLATAARGRIYFTSRLSNRDPKAGNVNSVYRIDAPGKLSRILAWPKIDMPNGIVTSPDDKIRYLIDADGREGGARRIRAYDLDSGGSVSNERLLYDFYPGRSGDRMAIDAEGNLYVAAGLHRRRGSSETLDTRPGIYVISPEGELSAFVETPKDTITNCTFGGGDLRTLYVACGKRLLSLRTRIPGKAAYRPSR